MKQQLTYKMHPIHAILYNYLQNRIDACIGSIRKTSIEMDKLSHEIDAMCEIVRKAMHSSPYREREISIYKNIDNRLQKCKKHRSDRLKIEYHNLALQFESLNRLFSRLGCLESKNGD